MNMAGSSNIPWGSNLQNSEMPEVCHESSRTYPTTIPFKSVTKTGTIPKNTPNTNPENELWTLLKKMNCTSEDADIPRVLAISPRMTSSTNENEGANANPTIVLTIKRIH